MIDERYRDMLYLPHKQSATRPHMPLPERAAQFAAFRALDGYDDAIAEETQKSENEEL